jgi:hypothetical protein
MSCRSGCPTQNHVNWGECVRAANLHIGYAASAKGLDATSQKKWDKELALYRSAREQGIQPAGTTTKSVRAAIDMSDKAGKAFDANTNSFK